LKELNQRFQIREEHGKFFTILLGSFNLDSRELRYVSAGNPWPILLANHETPRLLDVGGLPVGVKEDPGYVDEVMYLEPGDSLFLYSDGVLDARNGDGKAFGFDELIKCVDSSGDSLASTVTTIEEKALSWCNGQPQDDISVLAIKIKTGSR
jgi:sigma-B regulation protein RsbU (phosphoserine phosphatase)